MANIVGKIGMTLKVDAVPSAGAGTPSPVPTLAQFGGNLYIKTGVADTSWTPVGNAASSNIRTIAAADTILATDNTILLDSTGGAFNLALPNPTTVIGRVFLLVGKTGTLQANPVTLTRFAAEKIEGLAASKLLQTSWGFYNLVSDGTDWYVG